MIDARKLNDLIETCIPGHALPAAFYRDSAIFERDVERIVSHCWIYACHVSELKEVGDFRTLEVAGESVIIVRASAAEIRAHLNVCRHRGSRICWEAKGNSKHLVCPYHGWTYGLAGDLKVGRNMGPEFDKSNYALKSVALTEFEGMLFVNFDADADSLLCAKETLSPILDVYRLANTKVAYQDTWNVKANWKLALENFFECYHCIPAHPEYARAHTLSLSPELMEKHVPAMEARSREHGLPTDSLYSEDGQKSDPFTIVFHHRHPLFEGYLSGTEDGKPAAPPLGEVRGYDGGAADIQITPLCAGLIYPDHAVIYSFVPVDAESTDMTIVWLVREDAVEGKDYDTERLTWLWRVTTDADKAIILNNQRGVNSRFYTPGPYSTMENFTQQFVEWYIDRIRE